MTAVECTDTHREGDVVAILTGIEFELLGRDLPSREPSSHDQLCCGLGELSDRLGRTVDRQHVAGRANTVSDLTCRGAGAAADLDHPETGSERQGVDNRFEPG